MFTRKNKRTISDSYNHVNQLDLFSRDPNQKRYKKKRLKKYLEKWLSITNKIPGYQYYIVVFVVLTLIYGVFFSQFFSLQEINIYRNDAITNIDQAYRSVNGYRWKKIFSLNDKEITTRLQRAQTALKYIKIQKKLPKSLDIHLESYKPIFISGELLILENGSVIEDSVPDLEPLPKINISETISVKDILKHSNLEKIKTIWELLARDLQHFQIQDRIYYPTEEEALFITQQWAILVFDLAENIEHQTEKLSLYIQNTPGLKLRSFIYLDLRISGKVYLCARDNEYSCINNIKRLYWNLPFTILQSASISQNQQ